METICLAAILKYEEPFNMLLQLNNRTDYIKDDLCHSHSSLIVIFKKYMN